LDVIGVGKKMLAHGVGLFRPVPREVAASDVRVIVHKSAALAAQTFMLSMKAEGYDTCPMEGFDSVRVKKMLHLPAAAEINMIISYGKARPDGIYGPRFRIPTSEVVFEI
jgi:nitroreductase